MSLPTEEKLKEIAQKLAKVLRVQDWDISVHLISGYEMDKKYSDCTYCGTADRNVRLNTADIYLNSDSCKDTWYETLVHEMIHVQQTPLIHCTEAYFQEHRTYWNDLNEQLTEKQAQIFASIYPLERLEAECS
jgi:hypothetical protein